MDVDTLRLCLGIVIDNVGQLQDQKIRITQKLEAAIQLRKTIRKELREKGVYE